MNRVLTPNLNKPCTRCGDCCKAGLCPMGESVYSSTIAPCPGLKFKDNKSYCELIEMMDLHQFTYMSFVMGIGAGCTNDYKYGPEDDSERSEYNKIVIL